MKTAKGLRFHLSNTEFKVGPDFIWSPEFLLFTWAEELTPFRGDLQAWRPSYLLVHLPMAGAGLERWSFVPGVLPLEKTNSSWLNWAGLDSWLALATFVKIFSS